MTCEVILDLIPLYADGCCSAESKKLVEEHIRSCPECARCLKQAQLPLARTEILPPPKPGRIQQWKASVLQSVLFLVYFSVITVGVYLEARVPSGLMNGFAAFNYVVPATGCLLSLVHWYFIRLYSSRRCFVWGSVICTAVASALCFLVTTVHYAVEPELLPAMLFGYGSMGTAFFVGNLLGSWLLSGWYAKMVGKE